MSLTASQAGTMNLTNELRAAISRLPARVGARLRSERELAASLSLTHARVRRAYRQLVEEGILVQQQGAGTFVRRVPNLPETPSDVEQRIRASDLLHSQSSASPESATRAMRQELDLGLWWQSLHVMSPTQQSILASMVERIESLGHRVSLHAMNRGSSKLPITAEELAQRLRDNPRDAYLVNGWEAGLFAEALGQTDRPIVYFSTHDMVSMPTPCIALDTYAAVAEAMAQFEAVGIDRVGMLIHAPVLVDQKKHLQYLRRRGFDVQYGCVSAFELAPVADAVDQLLNAGCEGIYIEDNHLLPLFAEAIKARDLKPGSDIAVITHSNRNQPFADEVDWSCIQFDPELLGRQAVDTLVHATQDADFRPTRLAMRADWLPGATHLLKKVRKGA